MLRLLFRGPFAFVVYPDHMLALAPFLDTYRYTYESTTSNWRGSLDPGYHRLGGLPASRCMPGLDESRNIIIDARRFGIRAVDPKQASYCAIQLPFPEQVVPQELSSVSNVFSGPLGRELNARITQIPSAQALFYRLDEEESLTLSMPGLGHVWTASSLNLDIIAEPRSLPGPQHAVEPFQALVGLFPGLQLALKAKELTKIKLCIDAPSINRHRYEAFCQGKRLQAGMQLPALPGLPPGGGLIDQEHGNSVSDRVNPLASRAAQRAIIRRKRQGLPALRDRTCQNVEYFFQDHDVLILIPRAKN